MGQKRSLRLKLVSSMSYKMTYASVKIQTSLHITTV